MKAGVAFLCLLALANGSKVEVTPVQKVIALMEGILFLVWDDRPVVG